MHVEAVQLDERQEPELTCSSGTCAISKSCTTETRENINKQLVFKLRMKVSLSHYFPKPPNINKQKRHTLKATQRKKE